MVFSFSNFTFVNSNLHIRRFRAGLTFAETFFHEQIFHKNEQKSRNSRNFLLAKLSPRKLVRAKQINAALKAVDIKYHDFKKFEFSKISIPQKWLKSKQKTDCENFRF